jgi:toxin ParE1/3/4
MAAAQDLENITDYLFEKTPGNATRLVRKLYEAPSALRTFPNRGRLGRIKGPRELVVPSSPFIVIYRVTRGTVNIVRILHGAQKWP